MAARSNLVLILVAACNVPAVPVFEPVAYSPSIDAGIVDAQTYTPITRIEGPPLQDLTFEGNATHWQSTDGPIVLDEGFRIGRALRLDATGRSRSARTSGDARQYAGKRVRLRGLVKHHDVKLAALWLRADSPDGEVQMLAYDDEELSGTGSWSRTWVELDVPANAGTIVVGVEVKGGTAWFDDLELAVIEASRPITIRGVVMDRKRPAAGAEVALVGDTRIEKIVRADARGEFAFETLPGEWRVSAHRAGAVGAFVKFDAAWASWTELAVPLARANGVRVGGTVTPAPPAGTYLQIMPEDEQDAICYAVPVELDGTFAAVLPRRDAYWVELAGGGDDLGGTRFRRTGDRVDISFPLPSREPPPREVLEYVAEQGFDDLAKLDALVGDARIVALGEATHGTREFFALKHRFIEHLVAKLGFTVFAIEADPKTSRAVDDYVRHRTNELHMLDGMWATEEVRALIEWLRTWNADPAHASVTFVGIDTHADAETFAERDRAMANSVGKLVDRTRTRVVVWAHNGHIAKKLRSQTSMGMLLRAKYKRAYRPIGFVFGEGSFRAYDRTRDFWLAVHTLGPPPAHYASRAFAAAGKPWLVLDLRAPPAGVVRDWFSAPHPIRDTGRSFAGEQQMTHFAVLPSLFDAVIYVDKTTASRPLTK